MPMGKRQAGTDDTLSEVDKIAGFWWKVGNKEVTWDFQMENKEVKWTWRQ